MSGCWLFFQFCCLSLEMSCGKWRCPFYICIVQLGMCSCSSPVTTCEENHSAPTALHSTPLTPKAMDVECWGLRKPGGNFWSAKMFIDSQWFQCSKEKCQIVYKVPQPWFSDSTLSWFFTEWPRTSTGRPRHVAWTCETGEQRWFGTQHEHTNWCDFGEDLDLWIFLI